MRILHISSEVSPFAKVGGLGDVVSGLALAVKEKGHEVAILLPKYDIIDYSFLKNISSDSEAFQVEEGQQKYKCSVSSADYQGIKILLLECNHPAKYFERKTIYGCPDDNDRFIFFCKAAVEYLAKTKAQADAIHLHDWPTALISLFCKQFYSKEFRVGKIVFTIHNLNYQGRCSVLNLIKIGIKEEKYFNDLHDPIIPGVLNLLKGALKYSDALTTVSPTYEKEIKSEQGGPLHFSILEYEQKLKGILNGIDTNFWNPQTDSFLQKNYSSKDSIKQILSAKKENFVHLRKQIKLRESKMPLVVCISRLVPQKGPELIQHAISYTIQKGAQFVLLGSTFIKEISDAFQQLKKRYSDNNNVVLYLEYNEPFSHLLYAAADIIVIPSIFEPCGLTQMIAMRYGTVPVARRTGGLADTVFDIDTSKEPSESRNGFTFDHPDFKGVEWALDRALKTYQDHPDKWHQLMKAGMDNDFSWKKPAEEYIRIYQS